MVMEYAQIMGDYLGGVFSGIFILLGIGFAVLMFLALYIYHALAWSTIAQKFKYDKHWLAWIPIANLFLLPILARKEKDWPWGFLFLIPIVNIVFFVIWTWQIFEKRDYPGWFSLGILIPQIGGILYLIAIGFVAWYEKDTKKKSKK